jgi:hypothetical protein
MAEPDLLPAWSPPPDLAERLAEDGIWEDESWEPLTLSVLADTVHQGRPIARSWQIAFAAFDPRIEHWTTILDAAGIEPDGDGWSEVVHRRVGAVQPDLLTRLHDDSEGAACVIWVEAEADARLLIETIWQLLNDRAPSPAKLG